MSIYLCVSEAFIPAIVILVFSLLSVFDPHPWEVSCFPTVADIKLCNHFKRLSIITLREKNLRMGFSFIIKQWSEQNYQDGWVDLRQDRIGQSLYFIGMDAYEHQRPSGIDHLV